VLATPLRYYQWKPSRCILQLLRTTNPAVTSVQCDESCCQAWDPGIIGNFFSLPVETSFQRRKLCSYISWLEIRYNETVSDSYSYSLWCILSFKATSPPVILHLHGQARVRWRSHSKNSDVEPVILDLALCFHPAKSANVPDRRADMLLAKVVGL
jgi:hypothetical protein